jgi:hypothetical protein
MSSSEELMKKRREYYRLLDNVKELTVSLSASYNDMEDAINIGEYFTIDEMAADNGKIKKIRETVDSSRDYLNNTVIPAIVSKINQLSNDIEDAVTKEASEAVVG